MSTTYTVIDTFKPVEIIGRTINTVGAVLDPEKEASKIRRQKRSSKGNPKKLKANKNEF